MDKKYRILLVEDEESLRLIYKEYMEISGFEVVEALNGEMAIEKVKSEKNIDMVLLDIMLPKVDGITVLETIRSMKEYDRVPVYLMTVLGRNAVIEKAYEIGADGYIVKDSLTPEEIKNEVVAALNKRKIT